MSDSAVQKAAEHFERKDDRKAKVERINRQNGYIDLTFDHDAGIYKTTTEHLLTTHNVMVSGVQSAESNDNCQGEMRVWFRYVEVEVPTVVQFAD